MDLSIGNKIDVLNLKGTNIKINVLKHVKYKNSYFTNYKMYKLWLV